MPVAAERSFPSDVWQPEVRWSPDFARRVERFWERSALADRGARAGGTRSGSSPGVGFEFAGFRPYRPGEDLRHVDWNLYARSDTPFVRVHRAEAGERWALVLDTRAGMGVGRPSKLQRAAEVALALAGVALARGHRVRLVWSGVSLELTRRAELVSLRRALAGLVASGARPGAEVSRVLAGAGVDRLCVLGDLWQDPDVQLRALVRPGRTVAAVSWLAPHELRAPQALRQARWVEPSGAGAVRVELDRATRARYARRVDTELLRWRRACARLRIAAWAPLTSADFEGVAQELIRSWADGV